jgi:hypothetical protein
MGAGRWMEERRFGGANAETRTNERPNLKRSHNSGFSFKPLKRLPVLTAEDPGKSRPRSAFEALGQHKQSTKRLAVGPQGRIPVV